MEGIILGNGKTIECMDMADFTIKMEILHIKASLLMMSLRESAKSIIMNLKKYWVVLITTTLLIWEIGGYITKAS